MNNVEVAKKAIVSAAMACEAALRMEQIELGRGDFGEAAYWADRSEDWSSSAFGWTHYL
jgi:hypothetical protein